VLDWVRSPEFDDLIVSTVRSTYASHEQERFVAHFRGLTGLWESDESARLGSSV